MGILRYIILISLLTPIVVHAQLSPGDLAEPHAAFEGITNCTKCHELGKGPSAAKCLECHTALSKQITEKKGLHYKYLKLEKKLCFDCHNDHAGRDFQLILWEKPIEQFDHTNTGYQLLGKHSSILCRDCHNPALISNSLLEIEPEIDITKTFLGLNQRCLSCHNDEHRKQLGDDCLKCHNQDKWIKAEYFDHKQSKFVLTGKHKKVDCQKCHKTITEPLPASSKNNTYCKYVGLNFPNCTSCHADIHKDKFGKDCSRCHVTGGWKILDERNMDHNKTEFKLTGKHVKVKCDNCHKPQKKFTKTEFDQCSDCHKDIHKGSFGNVCDRCHVTEGWKILDKKNTDHSKTDFPLVGKHTLIKCEKCHKPQTIFTKKGFDECLDCHSDYHKKQFVNRSDKGACESCHNVQGFSPAIFPIASHNKTEFQLVGAHLAQPCIVCHKLTNSKQPLINFKPKERFCKECHKDPHMGQFNKVESCANCHNAFEWNKPSFNHQTDSSYPLLGAHKKVSCNGCHKERKNGTEKYKHYKPIDTKCESCHISEVKPLEIGIVL